MITGLLPTRLTLSSGPACRISLVVRSASISSFRNRNGAAVQTSTSPIQRPKPRFHFRRSPGTSPSATRIAPWKAPGWRLTQARRVEQNTDQDDDHYQVDSQYRQERDKHDLILQTPGRDLIILGGLFPLIRRQCSRGINP